MNLTDEDVREILRLLDESPYDELHLETDRFKLTLKSAAAPSWLQAKIGVAREIAPHASNGDSPPPEAAAAAPAPADGEIRAVPAPMPGTFYRAPSPGAEPFVETGSEVAEDTILGLVETMKLMNSVMAGCRGKVVEICTENGALVDTDDTLVRIRVTADA